MGCKFLESCPLWDMSSSKQEWCCGDDPIDDRWELCPIPKRREEELKEIKMKKVLAISEN